MKELSIEEKAKHYDEALKVLHKYDGANIMFSQSLKEEMFPELAESEDERIRKAIRTLILSASREQTTIVGVTQSDMFAWLEKQGEHAKFRDSIQVGDKVTRNEDGVLINLSQLNRVAKPAEKQGEQEQLYIRFGEIPTDEKSKIYKGEIEVGTENGVSVYPAFRTDEGNIVLGLSLPITKTTLYTQQHLIEYDDRPCYLVKGDYVGKDTDGQPLINNVSIIKKIDNYRVKEEKQGEQKFEQKFFINDKVVHKATGKIWTIHHYLKDTNSYYVEDNDGLLHHYIESELKLIEQKSAWSGEDEYNLAWIVETLLGLDGDKEYTDSCKKMAKWLKSLKDRVLSQPKQEWSEDDIRILTGITNYIGCSDLEGWEEWYNWLKSLKPQKQ